MVLAKPSSAGSRQGAWTQHARAEGHEGGKGRTACPFHVSLEDLGRKAGERVAPSSQFKLSRSLGREGERKPVFCRLDLQA